MDFSKVSQGKYAPSVVNVIIEISASSLPIKYEFDKESKFLTVDRFLSTSMTYPCNYGFIPNTCAGDGDPVDVLVLTQFPVISKALISVRPIGALLSSDEKGQDEKVIAVPISSVDSYYDNIKCYSDVPQVLLDKIAHFFSHYKDLEKGKTVIVGQWVGFNDACEIIRSSMA